MRHLSKKINRIGAYGMIPCVSNNIPKEQKEYIEMELVYRVYLKTEEDHLILGKIIDDYWNSEVKELSMYDPFHSKAMERALNLSNRKKISYKYATLRYKKHKR